MKINVVKVSDVMSITIILAALVVASVFAQEVNVTDPTHMQQYQWQHRLLVLFAPSAADRDYQTQVEALASYEPGLAARDMVVFYVLADGESAVAQAGERRLLTDSQTASLRAQFDVPQDAFTLLLIGKDGGIKRHEHHAVTVDTLFAQIDSMPMRQREMLE